MMREWCFKHQLLRLAGEQCGQCAIEPAPVAVSALPMGAFAFCPYHDLMYRIGIGARCPLCVAPQP